MVNCNRSVAQTNNKLITICIFTDDIKNKYGKKTSKKSNDKNGIDGNNHKKNNDENIVVVSGGGGEDDATNVIITKKSKKRKHLEKVDHIEKASSSSPLRTEIISQKVNKLIIKNDTEDEEELRREVERSSTPSRRHKRSNVSPIKFDIAEDDDVDNKKSPKRLMSSVSNKRRKSDDNHLENRDERLSIKRSNSIRKYDDLPPCKLNLIFNFSIFFKM